MRVVFAGTPEVALPALDAVAASRHELVGVVSRADLLRALEDVEPRPAEPTDSIADQLRAAAGLASILDAVVALGHKADGVYLVGGGTHPGSGLPVIYEGARITSGLLARDLGMRPVPVGTGFSQDMTPAYGATS